MKSKGMWFLLTGILIGVILVLLVVLFNGTWSHNNNMDQDHMMGNDSSTGQMGDHMMGNNGMDGNSGPMGHGATQDLQESDEPEQPLPIPTALQPDRVTEDIVYYTVEATEGMSQFFQDGKKTETFGYNGDLLGPMLELPKGKTVVIDTINRLDEPTTFHWHGLVIPAEMDGGPHQAVAAGDRAQVRLDIDQEPSTLWFHPHPMGSTAEQVYKGLAGLLYVTDDAQTGLPNDYGVDDIPLIVQDRLFTKDGELDYDAHMNVDGTTGDTILANGAINTTFDVQTETLRVRLVNGSNARDFDFTLSNGEVMTQIAGDGGPLERPVEMKTISLTPGERAEVLIDFSQVEDDVALEADGVTFTTFRVGELDKTSIDIPTTKTMERSTDEKADRRLTLFGMGNMVSINGNTYDPDRIDIKVKQGDTEIWEIENKPDMMGGMTHPFHIHGVQFRIISRDGNPPAEHEKGWKDTVAVAPDERVKIELSFTETGTFMYHCHILEHEENGMMGQLKVTK
ncbi:multicopper oxidase family protein [Exiguobacterium aestuarii]|uniref:multicopper oxidase family protein n=1 Tax=Exiguobacterium aestuarii TaxID=273527 RepID=UPI001CD5BB41|nr:multicopper oxidase domain-containing protein [Exiguobacterium aestuarii]MCA0981279.1 multicopper oxidase domain-containing protein [Exiguobacterium aestuarii]